MKFIIGIDEAGRGPLAGPVVVAGVLVKKNIASRLKILKEVKDSKKLSPKKRDELFFCLANHPKIKWHFSAVWPTVIDRINIARATNLGALRLYKKLICTEPSSVHGYFVMLDGSISLPSHISHETIIKGDEKIPVISAASIIAKVIRDRIMLRLHKKFPQYRFDLHKGYGTKLHKSLLSIHGSSEIHRSSFLKKFISSASIPNFK